MSPEQINGGDVDARSDVYAVGCVLTELLTGKPPFVDGNPLNLMYRQVHTAPPAPSGRNPRVTGELDALVLSAPAKDPARRPADAGLYRARVRAALGGQYEGGDVATTLLPPTSDGYDPKATPFVRPAGPTPTRRRSTSACAASPMTSP